MTQDEIIKMAKLAGWEMDNSCVLSPQILWYIYQEQLETFAKLVAQHEREQNAKICQDLAKDMTRVGEFAAMLCAKLIRGQA
jgi:hypothetical protein